MAQLLEALRYNPGGRGFDSVSNRSVHQEYFLGGKGGRCLRLTNLPPTLADYLEVGKS